MHVVQQHMFVAIIFLFKILFNRPAMFVLALMSRDNQKDDIGDELLMTSNDY